MQTPEPSDRTAEQTARTHRKIPRTSRLDTLRMILNGRGERIDMLSRLRRQYDRFGKVVLRDMGFLKMVNLFGPDANQLVLIDRERIFSARVPWMNIMGKIFPNGLLLMDGDQHKQHRKIMQEAFTRAALANYAEQMNPMIERGIADWRDAARPLLAFRIIKELTLNMAASIFVGVNLGEDTRRMNTVFEDLVAASMSQVRLRIPGLEFYRGLKGREFMVEYFRRLIGERRRAEGNDMFSRLCRASSEEGARFVDGEIIDHMIFLMMAAHDTTTSTLTSMVYELARNPEWQDRIRAESQALGETHLAFENIDRLESLTYVMKETLRRYPALPVIPRVATADFEFDGCRIPARSLVVISPIHTHHMAEWWDDPYRFDPERFAPHRKEDDRHAFSWVPFGGGPHMCLGFRFAEIQIKSIIHQLVQRYRWTVPSGYTMPVQQAPISKPMDGLPIDLVSLN